eukprot:scaffold7247_cov28-Tisochrysis_lutea.AAC.2
MRNSEREEEGEREGGERGCPRAFQRMGAARYLIFGPSSFIRAPTPRRCQRQEREKMMAPLLISK